MKSLMWLLGCMLKECSIRCDTDTHRDILTITRRTKHEGISFLTITLPQFCSDFESCLSKAAVDSDDFKSFRKKSALPAFLQGLLSQVFDPCDGKLLNEPSHEAILCIRQVCLLYKKVYLDCSQKRVTRAYDKFVEIEDELKGVPDSLTELDVNTFKTVSGVLWAEMLGTIDHQISSLALVPKHGPGATAEKISGNQKFSHAKWHSRLDTWFPYDAFGLVNPSVSYEYPDLDRVEFVEPDAEMPVRVITVPKTLKTPRIIAIEPVCMQYVQQGLLESIVQLIESRGISSGHVNFTDQSINRVLAEEGSISGLMATIDLSDASDRVHKDLVYQMLSSCPNTRDAIFSCRSTRADLPNGKTITLRKFASMGSALCFPIESMMFFTLCILARLKEHNLRPTPRNITKMARRVFVYGDDIIVPTDEVSTVTETLTRFGLKVNPNKSFSTGRFRESCGMDAYNGTNVTPVYARTLLPCNRSNTSELVSYVSFANHLYTKGWWTTARHVRNRIESILGPLPTVRDTSPCLGWNTLSQGYSITKWEPTTQSYKVKGYVVTPVERDDPLQDYGALMKFFLKRGKPPIFGKHLERTIRPGSVNIKYRWVQPF